MAIDGTIVGRDTAIGLKYIILDSNVARLTAKCKLRCRVQYIT